jgi:fructokinase
MIVVCGEALIDFTPVQHNGETVYVPRPGGSPYNVAIGLARLGMKTAFFGGISNDSFGRMLRHNLSQNRVDASLLIESDEPTTLAFVHPRNTDEQEYAFYNTGTADRNLLPEHVPASLPPETSAVHFGSISTILEPGASTLEGLMRREKANRIISFDPNVRPAMLPARIEYARRVEKLVAMASIVKVSKADLSWLYPSKSIENIADSWLGKGPSLVIVTLGKDGAVAFGKSANVIARGRCVKVADTVGAGDAFMSGLLASLEKQRLLDKTKLRHVSEHDIVIALNFANQCASLTCERVGADPPFLEELDETSA